MTISVCGKIVIVAVVAVVKTAVVVSDALEDLLLSADFADLAPPSLVVDFSDLDDFNLLSSPSTVGSMDDAATTVIK